MTIKVGRSDLKVSTPSNLDDQLVELCGCSAKEMRQLIDGPVTPSTLATALMPFVADDVDRHELGRRIARSEDINEVRNDVLALYDKADKPEKGASDGGKAKA